jgi:hypothetical protein
MRQSLLMLLAAAAIAGVAALTHPAGAAGWPAHPTMMSDRRNQEEGKCRVKPPANLPVSLGCHAAIAYDGAAGANAAGAE